MKKTVVFLLVLPFFLSCSGAKKTSDLSPPASDETITAMPDWYLNVPEDPNYLFATASSTSRDLDMAASKASQNARAEISRQLETKLESLTKSFMEEVGSGDDSELLSQFTEVNKSVSSQVLNGSKVVKKELKKEGEIYRAYILMNVPVGAAMNDFMNIMKQREHLYTRFRATQAYDDLEKEVQKYEQFKKEQKQGME